MIDLMVGTPPGGASAALDAVYLRLDGTNGPLTGNTQIAVDKKWLFGNAGTEAFIRKTASNIFQILNTTSGNVILGTQAATGTVSLRTNNIDRFTLAAAGTVLVSPKWGVNLDMNSNAILNAVFSNPVIQLNDGNQFFFGTGADGAIGFDGTDWLFDLVTGSYKFRNGTPADLLDISQAGVFTLFDGANFVLGTTTGTKWATATTQKQAWWGAAPIVQPTNAIAAAAFVANTSGIVDDSGTWGGYTIGQVVQALRNEGLLA